MSVIEKLKNQSLQLRKQKSAISASIVFALSEVEKVGKNSGNRATTEDEAIRAIQKIITTIDENLKYADKDRTELLNLEKTTLQSVLPQMATEDDVIEFLKSKYAFDAAAEDMPKKGEIMRALRDQFGSLVDMKRAGSIVSELYGI